VASVVACGVFPRASGGSAEGFDASRRMSGRANGYQVSARGRVGADIITAFKAVGN
jgi:hypothetical protein